jgi:hypothetical protein
LYWIAEFSIRIGTRHFIVIKQFRVAMATICWALKHCMRASYLLRHERAREQYFVQFIAFIVWILILF